MARLRQFVVFAETESGVPGTSMQRTQLTPAAASLALRSPLLQPLSPPPADAEVQQLEAEVTAASLRVAELRTSMQARLQDMLATKLAACRPSAELEAAPSAAVEQQAAATAAATERHDGDTLPHGQQLQQQQGDREPCDGQAEPQLLQQPEVEAMDSDVRAGKAEQSVPAMPMSPQPAELQQRLLQAANRMPALRAQLEQAADRLQRVVAAVAADINRPPPNTVEKAVLGKTPGRPGGGAAAGGEENAAGVSPLFKQVRRMWSTNKRRAAWGSCLSSQGPAGVCPGC